MNVCGGLSVTHIALKSGGVWMHRPAIVLLRFLCLAEGVITSPVGLDNRVGAILQAAFTSSRECVPLIHIKANGLRPVPHPSSVPLLLEYDVEPSRGFSYVNSGGIGGCRLWSTFLLTH